MKTLVAQPLTAAAFAPFGEVIEVGEGPGASANQGSALRFDWAAKLSSDRPGARPNLVVVRSLARALPFDALRVEKHPHSSQTFVPMRCVRYLVCVAPTQADGAPDLEGLTAFVAVAGQGINYRAGTWHHPIAALDGPADFAMLVWEDGGAGDCVEWPLPTPVQIVAR